MRLFLGIALDSHIKNGLHAVQESMKHHIRDGNFTRFDNFHITLRFLGETHPEKIDGIVEAMEEAVASMKSFTLSLGVPGAFKRGPSYLVWVGVHDGFQALKRLSASLDNALARHDFDIVIKRFHPHVTVARNVLFSESLTNDNIAIPFLKQTVDTVTLFESKRTSHGLAYIPQYECRLDISCENGERCKP